MNNRFSDFVKPGWFNFKDIVGENKVILRQNLCHCTLLICQSPSPTLFSCGRAISPFQSITKIQTKLCTGSFLPPLEQELWLVVWPHFRQWQRSQRKFSYHWWENYWSITIFSRDWKTVFHTVKLFELTIYQHTSHQHFNFSFVSIGQNFWVLPFFVLGILH